MDRQLRTEFDRIDKRQIARGPTRGPCGCLDPAEIRTDAQTERQYDLLRTIPGVGPQLAAYLMACTDGFARFNTPRQALVPCRCRTLRAQTQAAACVAAPGVASS
ncbi:MAG: transposase [Flavobacteriales bacterium]|nr:transposase [Flavobacteriales bacterium]